MTRVAFAADLHVDTYGSKLDPGTGLNARLLDYLATLRFVAQRARDLECDALIVAGDFTERRHVNEWLVRLIQDALSDGPKRQVFLRGNHDGEVVGEAMPTVLAEMGADWHGYNRPGLHRIGRDVLALIPHLDGKWLRTQEAFASVSPAEINRVLAEQYLVLARSLYAQAQTAMLPGSKVILVAHQGMSGGAMSETQAAFLGDRSLVIDAAALGSIGFDAIVAGHFHRHQVLATDPLTLYTGSIERVDFAEEAETKGFVVIDTDTLPSFEFVETPARRYVTLRGSFSAGDFLADNPDAVDGTIVRGIDLDPDVDTDELRRFIESKGAFEVRELRHQRVESTAAGGMAEDLAPEAMLAAYFADDPDRDALVELGREILAGVA